VDGTAATGDAPGSDAGAAAEDDANAHKRTLKAAAYRNKVEKAKARQRKVAVKKAAAPKK
jgi:hypothetical protein